MPLELSLPALAVVGAALSAVVYRFWPRIAVRTHTEKHRGIGIREIAVSITRPRFGAKAGLAGGAASHELVIYMTMRSGN
ncbi:MAG TPA: hypothetical protein VKX28_33375 [Xanthobacteraceae bacterium]|jgi:hypothetical protein|nr:hypothetical protein [Xanthobacteraceae bacterium]